MKRRATILLTTLWVIFGLVSATFGHEARARNRVSRDIRETGARTNVKKCLWTQSHPSWGPLAMLGPINSAHYTAARRQDAAQGKGQTTVSAVSIRTENNGEVIIHVSTSQTPVYKTFHLWNPARVVLDLRGIRGASLRDRYVLNLPLVKRVRVGLFRRSPNAQKVVRIVADLEGNPTYHVHRISGGGVSIDLKPHNREVAGSDHAVSKPRVQVAKRTFEVGQTRSASSSSSRQRSSKSFKSSHTPAPVIPARQAIHHILPVAVKSSRVAATRRFEVPAETPESLRAAAAAKLLEKGNSSALTGQGPAAATGASEHVKYTGEPISLNLKNVDLKDFFRLIHEISGLNIIVDPDVTGSVTLVLDDVPWDQALDIVLKENHLDKVLEGNVLRIARVSTLQAEQEAARKLAQEQVESQPLRTVFDHLSYAKATTVATLLKSWVGGGALSRRGNVLVDDRNNTLIISDVNSQIPKIQSVVSKLDVKAKQISIEARIVIANANFTRNLTAALSGAAGNPSGSTSIAGGTGGTNEAATANPTTPPVITPGVATGFGVFAIANASARYAINAAISAAEQKSQARTISRPSIVTQNNVPGTVQQGTQIPIQTTINNTISIQYVNATLSLTVTPQVTQDGNVFMEIDVKNASPGPALTISGPSINTQSATTQVLVPDGGTVVFGGITLTARTRSATYVPLLGNIPIIGHLFKTSNVQDTDNELLFFVSPKVLPG